MKGSIGRRGTSYRVRYWDAEAGKQIHKSYHREEDAQLFLAHLNVSRHEGRLDARDYQREQPLGFSNQADKWLEIRSRQVRCARNLRGHIAKAKAWFGQKNVKEIGFAQLEDFLLSLPDTLSAKSKKNVMTTLHAFWGWLSRREGIQAPRFPAVEFSLGWRKTVGKETQRAILEEIHRISHHINPRIHFAVQLLANFPRVRPGELVQVREGDIDRQSGEVWIRHTKEGREKRIYLLEEDMEVVRALPRGLPDMPFFRHGRRKGVSEAHRLKYSGQFGKDYLYKWWKRACQNLGIEGVDLYGGTRHSTVTAAREIMSPEEIRKYLTGHQTNVAFDRYLQVDALKQRAASRQIRSAHMLPTKKGGLGQGKILKMRG